jgi:hypothetical protein
MQLNDLIVVTLLLTLFASPLYIGWSFVRALERRNKGAATVRTLKDEAVAMRQNAELLASELSQLASRHDTVASVLSGSRAVEK